MAFTLTELIEEVRYRADSVNDASVTDEEITLHLNRGLDRLHSTLVASNESYWEDGYAITTENGVAEYDLPTDFYKAVGVDIYYNGYNYSLQHFSRPQRNNYQVTPEAPYFKYRIKDRKLVIAPTPTGAHSLTLIYIPRLTKLVSGTDTVDASIEDAWVEYALLEAIIKILIKRQDLNEAQLEMARQSDMLSEIKQAAAQRDMGAEWVIRDVYRLTDTEIEGM